VSHVGIVTAPVGDGRPKADGTSRTSSNPSAALSGDGGAGNGGGNRIGEGVSTAERTKEIEATSPTAGNSMPGEATAGENALDGVGKEAVAIESGRGSAEHLGLAGCD
jgi:hypothetical protein